VKATDTDNTCIKQTQTERDLRIHKTCDCYSDEECMPVWRAAKWEMLAQVRNSKSLVNVKGKG